MKKQLLTSTFFIVFMVACLAQDDNGITKNSTSFGVKGGGNFSYFRTFTNDNSLGTDFYFGLFSETRLNEKWSIQNELLYSMTREHRFFEVPILIKYHINDKWSVFAGPRLEFATTDHGDYLLERANVSAVLGIQHDVTKKLFVEAQLNLGITNQAYSRQLDSFNDGIKKHGFRVGIGYRF